MKKRVDAMKTVLRPVVLDLSQKPILSIGGMIKGNTASVAISNLKYPSNKIFVWLRTFNSKGKIAKILEERSGKLNSKAHNLYEKSKYMSASCKFLAASECEVQRSILCEGSDRAYCCAYSQHDASTNICLAAECLEKIAQKRSSCPVSFYDKISLLYFMAGDYADFSARNMIARKSLGSAVYMYQIASTCFALGSHRYSQYSIGGIASSECKEKANEIRKTIANPDRYADSEGNFDRYATLAKDSFNILIRKVPQHIKNIFDLKF